jgi:ferrous iron transport protein B
MTTQTALPTVVLAGNPNTGKTTLFNQLTGGSARVGNYPGITVDRHRGTLDLPDLTRAELFDSPGAYSLAACSAEEKLALDAIAGLPPLAPPDLVVVVVDASQLARNLYLTLQILELNRPVVVALNMVDALPRSGQSVDAEALAAVLGVPVVPIVARCGTGLDDLKRAIAKVLHEPARGTPGWRWRPSDARLLADVEAVAGAVPAAWRASDPDGERARALALWALLSLDDDAEPHAAPDALRAAVRARRRAAEAQGRCIEQEVIAGRYGWIDAASDRFVHSVAENGRKRSGTDRADRILLQPLLGFALFVAAMTLVFQALFTLADPLIGWIESAVGFAGATAAGWFGGGLLSDFVERALFGGVGSFLVFLPQILMLFLFIGLLEDTGYMARVAVLMDRLMRAVGLHGRAFVPMLSAYACAVPAVLATRTMERRRDRLITMLTLPLMTCSARLPVYGLLIAAIVPAAEAGPLTQGLLMAGMYLFGTVTALVVAAVLGRTLLRGPRQPLILEMPPYRMPHWPSVLRMMWERSRDFLRTAGTIILLCAIGMWALLSFPRQAPDAAAHQAARAQAEAALAGDALDERLADIDRTEEGARMRASLAGRLGHAIEPAIAPLGFDWKIGVGIIGAFAAREVFVGTMGVVYGVGEVGDAADEQDRLRDRMQADAWPDGRKVFTPLVCLSLMVFFALACQCMSTLAVVKRETRSWRWPAFLFAYMTALAWCASFAVYQGGTLLGFA